jgi:hypothetical protein
VDARSSTLAHTTTLDASLDREFDTAVVIDPIMACTDAVVEASRSLHDSVEEQDACLH